MLREGRPSSQLDIVSALRAVGHEVTQATVSRDLQEIGATKVRADGGFVYRLPDDLARPAGGDLLARRLVQTLEEFAVAITPAHALVVVKTAPGHASAVGRAIDLTGVPGVLGTVAGDDTLLVVASERTGGANLARRLSDLAGL